MGSITQRFAKQSFGCIGVAQRRKQEINGGTGGIYSPILVASAALHANVGLVHPPRFVVRLQIVPQPLFQFRRIALYPTPHRRMISLQPAFLEQLLHIPERQRIPQVPAHRAQDDRRLCLSPFENRRSGCHCGLLSAYQSMPFTSCNTTIVKITSRFRWGAILSRSVCLIARSSLTASTTQSHAPAPVIS